MKFLRIGFVLGLFFLLTTSSAFSQQKLLIGLIPEINVFEQKERYRLLGRYLSEKTGVEVSFTILSRYGNIIDRFVEEKMDGAFFGSFTGAMAIQKLGVVPLARPVNLDNRSTYNGYIFVRRDSPLRKTADLRGRKMAFVEQATTAGYIFPLSYLREHNISGPDGFFSEYFFAGSHDAAIQSVLNGKADVGAAKSTVFDRLRKENARIETELRIIAISQPVPSNGLCVRKNLSPDLREKLREALLGLHTTPEGEKVLRSLGALKFIETDIADYRPVIEMAKKAGIIIKKYEYRNK